MNSGETLEYVQACQNRGRIFFMVSHSSAGGAREIWGNLAEQFLTRLVHERVDALATNRCESPVLLVLQQHKTKPIASSSDIPAALRADLDLCFRRKIIGSFFIQELKDAGLLPMLQNSVL